MAFAVPSIWLVDCATMPPMPCILTAKGAVKLRELWPEEDLRKRDQEKYRNFQEGFFGLDEEEEEEDAEEVNIADLSACGFPLFRGSDSAWRRRC